MQIFWLIDNLTRVKLIQFQAARYKATLDMTNQKAPWELESPKPEIPVNTDMEDIDKFMKRKPKGRARG